MGTTRRQLVIDTLDALGDLKVLVATRDGSDVTFYDDTNLPGEPGAYRGREVLFINGTTANLGEIRYVTGSADRGLGFGVSLPAATMEDDECLLVNTRGVGYRFADVYRAINYCIKDAADRGPIPTGSDESTYGAGEAIIIPPEFSRIENVMWQDENDETLWRTVLKAKRPHSTGWWVDVSARSVYIGGSAQNSINGRIVKIWGLAPPAELYDDGDETEINGTWLAQAAAARIAKAKFLRSPTPETERTMASILQEAMFHRPRIITRRAGTGVDLT